MWYRYSCLLFSQEKDKPYIAPAVVRLLILTFFVLLTSFQLLKRFKSRELSFYYMKKFNSLYRCALHPEEALQNSPPGIESSDFIMKDYKSIDHSHLWHPFTQTSQWLADDPLVVERAEGYYLYDTEGKAYLDGVSSLWCNVYGHGEKSLVEAGKKQLDNLCHSTLLGLTHTSILDCTEVLMELAPKGLNRVFYSDSGTSAVEAAIRIALEWCQKNNRPEKTRLASLAGAYHGDTLGAVGIGFLDFFHSPLKSSVVESVRINPPHVYTFFEGLSEEEALSQSIKDLRQFFTDQSDTLAAFFVEPIVQGAAGIWVHPPEYLQEIAALCKKHSVFLIVDEVATGFYKTGSLFAHQLAEIEPDMMVLGKSLTGGYAALSCVLAREELFQGFTGAPSSGRTFFYGQTYAGNPIAARFAEANLKLIKAGVGLDDISERIEFFGQLVDEKISSLAHVDEVRRSGFMTGIELTKVAGGRGPYNPDEEIGLKIVRAAREQGAFIRPLGNAMFLMPAVTMPKAELEKLVDITAKSIEIVTTSHV